MSVTKAQLVGGVGLSTVRDLSVYGGVNATGVITATSFVGNGSGLTGAGSTVADDTTTNGTFYPVFTQTTSGTITASKVSTSKLSFNPSTGTLSAANVSIAGTLTYEDVTNVDSIGIVTARAGIVLGPTSNNIQLGTGTTISSPSSNTFTILTNGSERVRVDSSGRFGVGVTPSQALHVVGTADRTPVAFKGSGTGTGYLYADNTSFGVSTNSGNLGGSSAFVGVDNANHVLFITSGSERGRINSSGNFGIGTNNPSKILSLRTSSADVGLTLGAGANNYNQDIDFLNSADVMSGRIRYYPDSGFMSFWTTSGERVRISPNGGFSVGTTADPGAGAIYATGNVTAYYSDDRLKTRLGNIENAVDKVCSLTGFYYEANETAQQLGYTVKREVGVSAQDVEKVLPEIVVAAPIDEQYKTIHYERLVPLLVEAIKEQQEQIKNQQEQINELRALLEDK